MILCLGTTPALQKTMMFDRLAIDHVNRARQVLHNAAGKSVNVAKICRVLGHDVLAMGFLGGETGRFIRDELAHSGIQLGFIDIPSPTRTCTTVIDRGAGTVTELVEESPPVDAEAPRRLLATLQERLPQARALILSGSFAPGVPQDFYVHCLRAASKYDIPTILDAQGEPLRLALESRPLLIKPNRAELTATLGMPLDSDEALKEGMRRLIQRGPRWIVVTMGKDGAVVSDGRRFWRIHSPPVKAINPIGSGDAFSAALMSAMLNGQEIPQACRLAAACGAANALTEVAGQVRTEDVQRLLPQVQIEEI